MDEEDEAREKRKLALFEKSFKNEKKQNRVGDMKASVH